MLACFVHHVLSFLSHGCTCPQNPFKVFATLIYLYVGVSHHLGFCSPAVAHAVTVCHIFCNSLSMLAYCRIRSVFSFILFHYTPSLTPQRQPHARAVIHSLIPFRFATITFRGLCFFHAIINVVAALFRFTPQSFTTAHINPLSFFSLQSTTFTHYFQPLPFPTLTFEQKNAPNWLPAAPSHRALRFLCLGHSLHSQRLAHNAQA